MTNLSFPSQSQKPPPIAKPALKTQTSTRIAGALNRMPVGRKIALATLSLAVPYFISQGILQLTVSDSAQLVRQQQIGQQMLQPSALMLQNTQLVRLSSVNLLNGQEAAKEANDKQRSVLQAAFAKLLLLTNQAQLPQLTQRVQTAQKDLEALNRQVDARSLSAPAAQAAYSAMINKDILPLFDEIARQSQLYASSKTLPFQNGSDSNSVQLLTALVTTVMPQNLPNAGAIVSGNVQLINRLGGLGANIDDGARIEAQLRWDRANEALQRIIYAMDQAAASNDQMSALLTPARTKLQASANPLFTGLKTNLLDAQKVAIDSATLNQLTPAYAEGLFGSLNTSIDALGALLSRQQKVTQSYLLMSNIALLLVTALAALLFFLITRSITQPLGRLTEASHRLTNGEYNSELPVTSEDELGTLTKAFNAATNQLRESSVRSEQERLETQRLQENISQFLDVTMDIAEGDLTKRGKVTEDVLGNVVDSVNLMADELAGVLLNVQQASQSVTGGSQTVLETTHQIEQGTQLTAAEAQRVAERVAEITSAIRGMAAQAQASAQTARQALEASQQGQEAVNGTLEGMQSIRREIQNVAKRIKTLGDRSLEIQEIVDAISQIARQTHLLSLNASIEAAGAGETGGRFSAVANEVRMLADTSNQATARIATLIRNVQAEIQDVILSVDQGVLEMENGYRVAGDAGDRLNQIGGLTVQSAQLAEQIANTSRAQAQGVEQMSQAVQQIATVAQESQQSVQQGRLAAEELERLAQQLRDSLSRFTLPSTPSTGA